MKKIKVTPAQARAKAESEAKRQLQRKPFKRPEVLVAEHQQELPRKKKPINRDGNDETSLEPVNVMEEELPFMYETKNAEYVFGAELNDGFVTLTMPKDRFTSQPEVLHVKVELIN